MKSGWWILPFAILGALVWAYLLWCLLSWLL